MQEILLFTRVCNTEPPKQPPRPEGKMLNSLVAFYFIFVFPCVGRACVVLRAEGRAAACKLQRRATVGLGSRGTWSLFLKWT